MVTFDLPPKEEQHFITASLTMTREGHPSTLGVKGEIVTTFPPQHETRYLTRKYLASSGKLQISKIVALSFTAAVTMLEKRPSKSKWKRLRISGWIESRTHIDL